MTKRRGSGELHQKSNAALILARRSTSELIDILLIHRKDEIEARKIVGADLPSSLGREIDASPSRGFDRATVRRATHVVVMRAGRIDLDRDIRSTLRNHSAKHALSAGRATDIAHANE
jgi:hypothetical protein